MEELSKCGCGGTAVYSRVVDDNGGWDEPSYRHQVRCSKCGTRGPEFMEYRAYSMEEVEANKGIKDKAIKGWNTAMSKNQPDSITDLVEHER